MLPEPILMHDSVTWKPIPNSRCYWASSEGQIKGPRRILKPWVSNGYLYVKIHGVTKKVSTLVAQAFHPNDLEDLQVCHNNGDKLDNRASNLRWDTKSNNELDKRKHGTMHQVNRTRCPRGHLLESPNLIPSQLKLGKRSCLACNRFSNRNTDNEFILEFIYQEIMLRKAPYARETITSRQASQVSGMQSIEGASGHVVNDLPELPSGEDHTGSES